jgi:hypothetical protein
MAAANCDIGCRFEGKLFSMVTTWPGNAARFAHSFDSA